MITLIIYTLNSIPINAIITEVVYPSVAGGTGTRRHVF